MYSKREAHAFAPKPLPRGRHKLGQDEVRASQRERIVRAMLERVAEHGYAATTVQQVAAAARVSPNTFYRYFEDKLDAFLAVLEEDADELLGELFAAGAAPDWLEAVRLGTRRYLEWWPERPLMSRAFLLELPMAGGRAVERRGAIQDRFIALFEASAARARAEHEGLPPVSPHAVRVLVAGITELVAAEVAAGRLEALPALEDDLVHLTVKVLADDATAALA